MNIYKHRLFAKWAKKEGVTNSALKDAVREIEQGLVDANLGGGLYKKRFARKGQGKRGGYRTLLAYKSDERVFFVFGFAKNDADNVSAEQLSGFKRLATHLLSMTSKQVDNALKVNILIEVK